MNTNTPTTSPTVEQRLAALERSSRRWQVAAVGLMLCVGMGAAFAVQDGEFGTVKAKQFQVVDEGGTVQGVFGLSTNGDAGSTLVAVGVSASGFTIPGPSGAPYARITTIESSVEGSRVGGLVLTDHGTKKQTVLMGGKLPTPVALP